MNTDEQIIKVRVTNLNAQHYADLGYDFELNDFIFVPAKDLTHGSGIKVDVQCSYCGKIFQQPYNRYIKTKNKSCCSDCKKKKMMETSLEKYGNICSLRNPVVQNKSMQKNIENLGVQYPFQSPDILQKCSDTTLQKYGKRHICVNTSKQQKYVCELYDGILNYEVGKYSLDIFMQQYNIDIEWDGSGHRLRVKMGKMTDDEFDELENIRTAFILENGIKVCRIICTSDKVPDDNTLLSIKQDIIQKLYYDGYNEYVINLDDNTKSTR